MLQAKPKKCSGCGVEKKIWKRQGAEKFCKECWSCHSSKDIKPTKQKPLSPKSSKQQKLDAIYSILREKFLKHHPMCEANLPGCSLNAHDIHHSKGRTGNLMLDDTEFVAVCRSCHTWIHENPKQAKELGLYH
jgi:nitrate/TMAO reductase-like tetraheme cytochrome c subunit